MDGVTSALLFPGGAKEAVDFYLSVFPDSELLQEDEYPGEGGHLASTFRIGQSRFLAISGGPDCSFSMASSYMVECDTQEEIDMYWDRLLEGGEAQACGWLTDKFGVSWQIQPRCMMAMMGSGTPAQKAAIFAKMVDMVKMDLGVIERAFEEAGG